MIEDELKPYFNEPAADGESAGLERIFVLHSERSLEMDERSALQDASEKRSHLLRDYGLLFREGLRIESTTLLTLGGLKERAEHAGTSDAAAPAWREVLDYLLRQRVRDAGEIIHARSSLARALEEQGEHEEALRYLREIVEMDDAPGSEKARALHLQTVSLAKLDRFDSAEEARRHATRLYEAEGDHTSIIHMLRDLKGAYQASEARAQHASFKEIVIELAERLMRQGGSEDTQELESALDQVIQTLETIGDEGRVSVLSFKHGRAALWLLRNRGYDALHELRRVEEELRQWVPKDHPLLMQVGIDLTRARKLWQSQRRSVATVTAGTLPQKRPLLYRSGPQTASFQLRLRLVTPLLGGAAETREIDGIDIVRAPSIRGHLRFWWRALQGGRLSSEELYAHERRLWGGAGDVTGGRSTVELRVALDFVAEPDTSPIVPYGGSKTQGAYALWPARETRGRAPQPVAPRRKPGTRFTLTVTCPAGDESEVRAAVRAWILFGGYGGRTRRGAGSLTVEGKDEQRLWLPTSATREALREAFLGHDVLEPILTRPLDNLPLLAGAGVRAGAEGADAVSAWTKALDWLNDFRQKQPASGKHGDHDPRYARERGDDRRPGRSSWPEADKVRRLSPLSSPSAAWAHEPRHNAVPVWPRAGFGLPIVEQFQRKDRRTGDRYPPPGEPLDFELRWRERDDEGKRKKVHDRLASPLIVKALPLAGEHFAPCAIWLYRGYPENGEVIRAPGDPWSAGSAASFDRLVAEGDTARYAPLAGAAGAPEGTRLRKAFFDWLAATYRSSIHTVAP
ncbi:MAG: hypothetical protein IT372_07455 [Polyangiaceae bacterium]|nr:hypothetical protein [Polyangiaceae bacterium]